MYSCIYGDCDTEVINSPMPWVGIYVAAASLVCSLAMAADVFQGFRHKKLWFPCKRCAVNATSLTMLVAMKLPLDLTNPMPGKLDQLAKLGSTVFMSTVMANFMPSIGPMDDKEAFMNIAALGILVITTVANVCIQLSTGVIYALRAEQSLVIFLMLVLLVILSFSALAVPATKEYLEYKYNEIHEIASNEESEEIVKFGVNKLKQHVKKYWMMAATGSPQFVIASSVTCLASGAICFMTALILLEATVRVQFLFSYTNEISSDYKWSTYLILTIQSSGVVLGTLSPAFRWFGAIKFQYATKKGKSHKTGFKTENYWIQKLVEWKESTLPLQIRGRKRRKLVHVTKKLILNFCIRVQIVIVVASKSVLLFPVFFITQFLQCCHCCTRFRKKPKSNAPNSDSRSESQPGSKKSSYLEVSRYVLHLEGQEELPLYIMKNDRNASDVLIHMGKKQQPKYLKDLLQKSTSFGWVAKFDSDLVPSLKYEEPPNSWTLPVVTLTSIAIALPNIENHMVDRLVRSVSEGLLYVNLVEKNPTAKGGLINIIKAADMVWLGVDLYRKWLDEDLQKMALVGKTSKETLERLTDIAKNSIMEFKKNMIRDLMENPVNWPIKLIAANSMYRISQSLLLDYKSSSDQTDERFFDQLSIMIADLLGACLTNLPHVISMKCFCSAIKEREESVKHAARLLGETEEILKMLQERELPSLDPDQMVYIDEWRTVMKQKIPLAFNSSSTGNTASSGSSELHITIEQEA